MESLEDNDVVITGVSGVFPKADNVEEFANKLFNKENLLSDVPYMPCKLGKLNDLSKFDAEFFGFQPHRVDVMDPMARMILEKAYEALVDSGNNPVTLKGKNCGVFVGIHFLETEVLVYEKIQKGASLAISRSFNANRISYWLGVHGPSFTVDSACSSTLLALEMAYKAIRNGECESALVGGCHVCLHPALLLHLLKVGALNPNGESRVFDENAGGFCKAEAIGVFYLQKAKDAKRVYAKVINVRSNHDGSKPLFLSPYGPSQAKLLDLIYQQSGVDINSVAWIEAHATGTLVGDKQEVTAIDQVFKNRQRPLLIGSVKSNMGHAEAAAAVGSISKVLIAMETGFIPPNINISNVRKDIEAFATERIKVVVEKTPWKGGIVGISGFGMGGANTHAILQSFSKEKTNNGIPNDDFPRIVGVSGRTSDAVDAFLNYLESSNIDAELIALLHEIYSYNIPLHPYRGYIIVSKNGSHFKQKIKNIRATSRPLWFCFSTFENRVNSIYNAFKHLKAFKDTILQSDELLRPLGLNLIDTLESSGGDSIQPAGLFTVVIQIALNSLTRSLGLIANDIIGESYGGLTYAYVDKILTLDQALKIAYYCSSSNDGNPGQNLKTILPKVIVSSEEVLPKLQKTIDDQNSSLVDYLTKLLFNADYVEDKIQTIPKDAIILDFSSNKFSEALKTKLKGEGVLVPFAKDDASNFSDFVTSLGELYLLGINLSFQKLYPAVKFPVSKSTKMIAPLIKWKHEVRWPVAFSSFQERMLSGERKVSISLDNKEDAYIAGHEIDSFVFYPATGFIVLVWETLAQIHGKMYADLSVVFENIRLHKAVVLRRNEPVTLSIMVQKGNRNFEILHNNQIVVTGQVYVPSDVSKETLNVVESTGSGVVMDGADFYRHVLIKNYNYKGIFRGVKKIDSAGTRSTVAWNSNWVAYLDSVLHLTLLPHEFLAVPTEFEKFIIDVDKHKQSLKTNPFEIQAFKDKKMNVIQSGGVQVKGCTFRAIPVKLSSKIPLVQKYTFAPFESHDKKLPLKNAVHLFGQCIMDYVCQQTKDVKAAEILDDDFNPNYPPIAPYFVSFIKEQLLFQAKLSAYVNSNSSKIIKAGNGYEIIEGKLPLGEKVHVLICSQALGNPEKLQSVLDSVLDNGFIITREDGHFTVSADQFNLQVCGNLVSNNERLILLRKKIELNLNSIKIIKLSSVSFEWIELLQEALKIASHKRIILVSEKEAFSGILGFYNCLRLEKGTENVRCLCIMDDEMESFSLHDEFFRTQVLKDLAVNVYKDKEWGCYVKLPIDDLQEEKVRHAFVRRKNCGLKPSLKWYKGDLNESNNEDANIIRVYYASINSTDVLICKNRLAAPSVVKNPLKQDYALGMEFSGIGNDGKRYFGLRSYGCLSTLIEMSKDDLFVNETPKHWSLEDAATVPLAYYSVVYALVLCCKLKNKESILIHSAGTIIGQAAIHIAIYYNCNIFVTVSSVDEKLFIKENFPYISDSKIGYTDISFEQMIYEQTEGAGVNVILNSLPEDRLLASINCLSQHGRLVQVKRADFSSSNSSYVNKLFIKNASLYLASLENIFDLPSHKKVELKNCVEEHTNNGAIKPLARTSYLYSAVESAIEFASSSRNLGKCVIQIEPEEGPAIKATMKLKNALPRVVCDSKKSYIVCGGLGGMGMELVNWLVIRGARKVVVTSRRGVTSGSQTLRIEKWKSLGVELIVSNYDISDEEQTIRLLDESQTLGGVGGIFNLAAVLKDKMFKNQTADNFAICSGPKIRGTYHLDKFSRTKCPSLDYFVVFSSISSAHGNLGQTSYGLCNSAAERICEQRNADGLPALAIQWGAVGNVGMFVAMMDGNTESSYGGNFMQPIQTCLEVLDYCINQSSPVVVSCIIDDK